MESSCFKHEWFGSLGNTFFKMIYIIDDFLSKGLLTDLNSKLIDFEGINVGDKIFYTIPPETSFVKYMALRLTEHENADVENVLAFFRQSTDKLDTDWRIHSDSKIEGDQPDRALVLYLSSDIKKELHGTAFWSHEKYGDKLPEISNKEFDRLLIEDSNDKSKWDLKSVIGYKQNRLISYPCSYFHSKYPNKSWKQGRNIFVMFYKIKK